MSRECLWLCRYGICEGTCISRLTMLLVIWNEKVSKIKQDTSTDRYHLPVRVLLNKCVHRQIETGTRYDCIAVYCESQDRLLPVNGILMYTVCAWSLSVFSQIVFQLKHVVGFFHGTYKLWDFIFSSAFRPNHLNIPKWQQVCRSMSHGEILWNGKVVCVCVCVHSRATGRFVQVFISLNAN